MGWDWMKREEAELVYLNDDGWAGYESWLMGCKDKKLKRVFLTWSVSVATFSAFLCFVCILSCVRAYVFVSSSFFFLCGDGIEETKWGLGWGW